MRYFHLTLIMLLAPLVLLAQSNTYVIKGKVVDATTNEAIDYATILLKDKTNKKTLEGTTTADGGTFTLQSKSTDIELEISFIGYELKVITDLNFVKNLLDLGTIRLGEDTEMIEQVVVTGTKSTTEFRLDKRVFNVGSDLTSTGASALEVLNNVPSVNVNIEGQIALRGATGVQILINGKPSILADSESNALGTITADMIDYVEVITNPSAKYEAEGSVGIINIVLKKNEKSGLNGSVSVNAGVPHNHSVGVSLNKRQENFNLFTQLGVGYRSMPEAVLNINEDFTNNTTIKSEGKEFRDERFYNFILGTDYYINPLNVITLSGSFTYEIEEQPSTLTFTRQVANETPEIWRRSEETSANNPKYQYELQYKKNFTDHKDHQLLFSAIGNYFGKAQNSNFSNTLALIPDQITATDFREGKYTFNLDYTKPIGKKYKVETGAQYLVNDVSNDFSVSNIIQSEPVLDPNFTNQFNYNQNVFGAYGTASYEGSVWGVKLGARVENTDLSTLLVNTNERNSQVFTNLFPSAHFSYKFTERISFQAGYSRRIYRPRLWDLNPFFNIRNNFNIRKGNPNLLPEFTDSYETGVIFIYDKLTFNVNGYYRYTTDRIERVSLFKDGVNIWQPENIGTNKATGIEGNFKYNVSNFLTLTGDANYNVFKREGQFNDQVFDFSADQWSGKFTTKLQPMKSLDVEITTRYESREQTIQGELADNLFADFGLRYKIGKGKAVVNFSISDVFASRIRQNTVNQATFSSYSRSQRGRFATLGFSYGFGKGEAMTYGGGRRR